MKGYIFVHLFFSLILLSGCRAKHPSVVKIDPELNPNQVGSILVAPFISSVTQGEDPKRESESITNRMLWEMLYERSDHNFLSPEQFRFAMSKAKLTDRFDVFKDAWVTKQEADLQFLHTLMEALEVDLILIPHVYLWYKDEVDYRETGTSSSTHVGVTLSLVDPNSGHVLWEATDENYREAVRVEGSRVSVETAGIHRRVSGRTEMGRDMYAAPPYEDVASLVLGVLVKAIPQRGSFVE